MAKKTLLALIIIYFYSYTQTVKCQINSSNISFEHLSPNTGLPFSTVNDMLQDSKGFIWFATSTGLYRYDGNTFKIYQNSPFDSCSIISNKIYRIFELSDGNIMIGSLLEGLSIFDPKLEKFTNIKHKEGDPNSLSNNNIKAIFEDSKKRIWVGTEKGGLLLFDRKTRFFKKMNKNNPKALSNNITAITEDKKGQVWVCDTLGITLVIPEKEQCIRFNVNTHDNWENVSGWDKRLFTDSRGNIWITTHQSGLYRFNPESKRFSCFRNDPHNPNSLSNNNVVCISEDKNGNLWIGTDGGGVNIYDEKNNRFNRILANTDIPSSLLSNSVYSIFKDKESHIWIGTYRSGLNIYNPSKPKFRSYVHVNEKKNSLSGKQVLCIYQDSENKIWVGTDGNGLNLFNPRAGVFRQFAAKIKSADSLHSNVIKTIHEVAPNKLWIGTFQDGLEILDTKTMKFSHIQSSYNDQTTMSSNSIWSISSTQEGNLWLAMLGSPINFYDKTKQKFKRYDQNDKGIPTNTAIISLVDSKNRAWFGTGSGLISYDQKLDSFITYDKKNGLGANDVISIFEDSKHRLWIGTNGGGLNFFDTEKKKFSIYTVSDGLPTNCISAILEDGKGNLWLSTTEGISKFNPEKKTFRNYDKADGLPDNEFIYDCALKSKDGHMYFGSINGMVEFHPDSISDNPTIPPVYLTDLLLFNKQVKPGDETNILSKSICYTDEIVLTHDQTVITLSFSAANFTNQKKNLYAYQLLGFDEKWNFVGNKHEATYTNLAPGNYTFQVKTSNSDGVWNEKPTILKIRVLPPIWKRWYMQCLYLLSIFGMLALLRNSILVRERFKNEIRLEHIKTEKLIELNQEKLKFFTGISHEFRTPLSLIIDPIERLMRQNDIPKAKLKSLLQITYQNSTRLLRLVNQLIDFRKVEEGKLQFDPSENDLVKFTKSVVSSFSYNAKVRNINFNITLPKHASIHYFDKDKLDCLLFNLLSNAFRYTQDGGSIELKLEKHAFGEHFTPQNEKVDKGIYFVISVKDTGIGIEATKIPSLFDKFNETSNIQSFDIKGTGIGLSLVKEYVKLHQGYVYVESEENKGTTFTVLLPVKEAKNQNTEQNEYQSFEINTKINHQNDKETLALKAKLSSDPNLPIILIVEDNNELREYIKNELSAHFNIYTASNGEEGYTTAIEIVPDIVVSDLMMPIMDGVEMCKKIKQDEKTCHIPVILLTAKTADESKVEGYSGGADAYLTKPLSTRVLIVCIKNLLIQRKRLREIFQQNFISDSSISAPNDLDEKFASRINEIILKNIDNFDFNSEMLAQELGVSRTGLFRKIKALTGLSASNYIRNVRLKKAAQMLKEKRLQISEIALLTGFQQLSYFSKCFKEQYKKSPSDFMNME